MKTEMEQVKRTIRWLQAYAALASVALVILFVRGGAATEGVLRARGLIIEDEAGRERILLGATDSRGGQPRSHRYSSTACPVGASTSRHR